MKNTNYLQEAIRIGEQLLSIGEYNSHGMSWKTADIQPDGSMGWKKTEDIYNGVSGIVLFLLELYTITRTEKYLTAACDGMKWVEWYCDKYPTDNYALFTGRMGVSYTFLKLFEITKNRIYLHKALAIAKPCPNFLTVFPRVNDFINGISGTLLGLLHLHAKTKKPWLLKIINDYVDALIANAKPGEVGLYWDRNKQDIRPLCGLSHGSSGIGFVFLELGHYFNNAAFSYIAEQSFAYENYFFDKQIQSWPDFRLNLYTEDEIKKFELYYRRGEIDRFTQPGDMNAWCHGAAGIGLSRLRAFSLTQNKIYRRDSTRAIKKTLNTDLSSFTLCHGNGGNAELFLESYIQLHQVKYLNYAKKIADLTLQQKKELTHYLSGHIDHPKENVEDPSLFLGIAGIGYFLLRVYNPEKISSILAPVVPVKLEKIHPEPRMTITLPQLKEKIVQNIFPRTVKIVPTKLSKNIEITSLEHLIKKIIPSLSAEQGHIIEDTYNVELQKFQLENNANYGLLSIKERLQQKQAKKLLKNLNNNVLTFQVKLTSEVRFSSIGNSLLLVKLTSHGVKEIPINKFCGLLLKSFTKERQINEVLEEIFIRYNVPTKRQDEVQSKALEQIKEAIKYGVLSSSL